MSDAWATVLFVWIISTVLLLNIHGVPSKPGFLKTFIMGLKVVQWVAILFSDLWALQVGQQLAFGSSKVFLLKLNVSSSNLDVFLMLSYRYSWKPVPGAG